MMEPVDGGAIGRAACLILRSHGPAGLAHGRRRRPEGPAHAISAILSASSSHPAITALRTIYQTAARGTQLSSAASDGRLRAIVEVVPHRGNRDTVSTTGRPRALRTGGGRHPRHPPRSG